MFELLILFVFDLFFTHSSASSCWRDTTCTGQASSSFPGIWDQYNYSPSSRTISPTRILINGNIPVSDFPGPANYQGNGSFLIFDFGKEVGGIVTIAYNSSTTGQVGLAFSETTNYTGLASDYSNGSPNPDGAIYGNLTAVDNGIYTMPDAKLRGGFRYLTVFVTTEEPTIEFNITDITLEISFQPTWSNLQAYGGYFYSNDELLNKIWYASAYTLQTNAVPPNTGRAWPIIDSGWENDANLGTNGSSIYVDGAKRDRTVWSGDLAVAAPGALILGDGESVKNTLMALYDVQESTGELPFAGPPIIIFGSDTYHMSVMIATYDYILYTNDQEFLTAYWAKYQLAMSFITAKIDSTNLLNVTGTNDWGRTTQGGHNSEANMLLYRTLITGSTLATWANNPTLSSTWTSLATTLRTAINSNLLSNSTTAYQDSDTNPTLIPEDANSMALAYFVPPTSDLTLSSNISTQLTTNWGPYGAVSPELPDNIVAYTQSIEILGHLAARQPLRSLDLMRRSWGWYLLNPAGTQSTVIEGFRSDGTWGYRFGDYPSYSYTSHAHGWGAGPVEALVSGIIGLNVVGLGGASWVLAPQFGDLTQAQGGLTVGVGLLSAGWQLMDGGVGYRVWYDVPVGTNGTLVLPAGETDAPTVMVDGVALDGVFDGVTKTFTAEGSGGNHNITVTY